MPVIRPARASDAPAIAAIYAPMVADTIISFEETPPDPSEIARRMAAIPPQYPYLVAEAAGAVVGYAYAGPHHQRAAYRLSVDTTVYVAGDAQRRGVGRALYAELLGLLAARGFHAAFAAISLPNPGSVALHEAFNFTPVGIFREVGHKFGRWHDVGWWQRLL